MRNVLIFLPETIHVLKGKDYVGRIISVSGGVLGETHYQFIPSEYSYMEPFKTLELCQEYIKKNYERLP